MLYTLKILLFIVIVYCLYPHIIILGVPVGPKSLGAYIILFGGFLELRLESPFLDLSSSFTFFF